MKYATTYMNEIADDGSSILEVVNEANDYYWFPEICANEFVRPKKEILGAALTVLYGDGTSSNYISVTSGEQSDAIDIFTRLGNNVASGLAKLLSLYKDLNGLETTK